MGTNFYWRDRPCEHCGRHDEFHVGKRSAGWSFGFRAWPHRLLDENHPDWGFDPASPFGFAVASRVDWRRVFTERTGDLFDEYGQQVDDPVAWLDELEPPDADRLRFEEGQYGLLRFPRDPDREWRDPEGFRFHAGEFS